MSFWINVVVHIFKPLSKLDLPTLRKGSTEERTQRNKWKIWHSLGLEPRSPAFLVPMLLPLSNGCQWQNLNLYPYKLSDLIFTPLPSLHVDFFSTCCYLVFFFIICPVLISLYNIAVLIIICRFKSTLLLKYANPCRNWTFQRVASAGLKKGRNGTNEKSDTRQNSNPGPRHL